MTSLLRLNHVFALFQLMKLMAVRRVQLATTGRSEVPLPPAPPPHPGYAKDAAQAALKRHEPEFVNAKAVMVSAFANSALPSISFL